MSETAKVRVVIGRDGGKRYVLSAIEDDERFLWPSDRFLTCDVVIADTIVEIPLEPAR